MLKYQKMLTNTTELRGCYPERSEVSNTLINDFKLIKIKHIFFPKQQNSKE